MNHKFLTPLKVLKTLKCGNIYGTEITIGIVSILTTLGWSETVLLTN